jgi:hypothetical protein
MSMTATGRFTISRVPRSALVAALVAVTHLLLKLLEIETMLPADIEPLVERLVDGSVAVATLVMVVRTKWSLDDATEEHDGGERAQELVEAAKLV